METTYLTLWLLLLICKENCLNHLLLLPFFLNPETSLFSSVWNIFEICSKYELHAAIWQNIKLILQKSFVTFSKKIFWDAFMFLLSPIYTYSQVMALLVDEFMYVCIFCTIYRKILKWFVLLWWGNVWCFNVFGSKDSVIGGFIILLFWQQIFIVVIIFYVLF